MGFPLLQKTTEMCVDRQIKVLGSYLKGHRDDSIQGVHPFNQWSYRRWTWMDVFLTTLVHNLSPTTSGHNDHRFFICFPLICWCGTVSVHHHRNFVQDIHPWDKWRWRWDSEVVKSLRRRMSVVCQKTNVTVVLHLDPTVQYTGLSSRDWPSNTNTQTHPASYHLTHTHVHTRTPVTYLVPVTVLSHDIVVRSVKKKEDVGREDTLDC
jgi:hypothetical protein